MGCNCSKRKQKRLSELKSDFEKRESQSNVSNQVVILDKEGSKKGKLDMLREIWEKSKE